MQKPARPAIAVLKYSVSITPTKPLTRLVKTIPTLKKLDILLRLKAEKPRALG